MFFICDYHIWMSLLWEIRDSPGEFGAAYWARELKNKYPWWTNPWEKEKKVFYSEHIVSCRCGRSLRAIKGADMGTVICQCGWRHPVPPDPWARSYPSGPAISQGGVVPTISSPFSNTTVMACPQCERATAYDLNQIKNIPPGCETCGSGRYDITGRQIRVNYDQFDGSYLISATPRNTTEIYDHLTDRWHEIWRYLRTFGELTAGTPEPPREKLEGAIRLWRYWLHDSDTRSLFATVRGTTWRPGVTVMENGTPPKKKNAVGFHGFNSYDLIQEQESDSYKKARRGVGYVLGSVLCYGKMVIAAKGARAEFAIPEYFVLTDNDDWNLELLSTAEKYGMKPISEAQARELKTGLVPWVKEEEER